MKYLQNRKKHWFLGTGRYKQYYFPLVTVYIYPCRMNASSMNGAGTSGGGAGGGGLPMGVPVMGGGGNQPMGMVPNTQGIMAQGKPGAPNQNVLDAVKKVGSSIHCRCISLRSVFRIRKFLGLQDPDLSINKQKK
jgi:hypothetical protein